MMNLDVTVRGEILRLYADKAALWKDMLLIADVHFGKGATFRRAGIPVPVGTTASDLDRLTALLDKTRARQVLFLGDFAHEGGAIETKALHKVAAWRAHHAAVDMTIVVGNHDRGIAAVAARLNMRATDAVLAGPFLFRHEPPAPAETPPAYVIAGHLHPAVRLEGEGGARLRAPCFWFSQNAAVFPAFGGFTGLFDIQPGARDGIVVVGEGALAEIQKMSFDSRVPPKGKTLSRRS